MSSEFSSYFEEFLKDDINEFDIFKDDFSINESDGQQNGDDLQLQCRASSSFDLTISKDPEDPCPAINTANTTSQVEWAPWTLETLLPKTDWGNNNRQYGDESG